MAYKVFPWCTEGGLDVQGEGAQTPSAGPLKYRQLQDVFVQMHSNVSSQFIWKVMQQLIRGQEKNQSKPFLVTIAMHFMEKCSSSGASGT